MKTKSIVLLVTMLPQMWLYFWVASLFPSDWASRWYVFPYCMTSGLLFVGTFLLAALLDTKTNNEGKSSK